MLVWPNGQKAKTNFLSDTEPCGCKNQVDVLRTETADEKLWLFKFCSHTLDYRMKILKTGTLFNAFSSQA